MWEQFLERDRQKWLFPLAILLVLNILFLFMFTIPSGNRFENKDYDIREAERSAALVEKYRDGLRANLDRIRGSRHAIDQFRDTKLLRREGGFTAIRDTIGQITGKEGVDPDAIAYSHKYLDEYGLVRFSMKVPLGGAYNSLRRIIRKVEESEYFLVIKEIEMKNIEEKRGKKKLELGVVLLTYFVGN